MAVSVFQGIIKGESGETPLSQKIYFSVFRHEAAGLHDRGVHHHDDEAEVLHKPDAEEVLHKPDAEEVLHKPGAAAGEELHKPSAEVVLRLQVQG